MKAILMSIKPKYVAEILNGNKTIEIRKRFPKDYVGWVYIYNTKTTKDGVLKLAYIGNKLEFVLSWDKTSKYQGKVIARFWCDKVEEYINGVSVDKLNNGEKYSYFDYVNDKVLEKSCLTDDELRNYCEDYAFSVIHITKLEIFDKPKDIKEFKRLNNCKNKHLPRVLEVSAPQSWCYIEV